MWLLSKKPTQERLRQHKTLKISGMKFVIRKINPLVDFPVDKMPQIFSSFITRRKTTPEEQINEATLRKSQDDMKNIIAAGLVKPEVTFEPVKPKDNKIAIDDIMSDSVLALKLYTEIIVHSLNMFKGLKGVFFSVRTKRAFYLSYRKNLENYPMK